MRISIRDDMDLDKIAESGQCFRWELLENGGYRIPHGRHCLKIRMLEQGEFEADCMENDFQEVWSPYFDLERSYSDIHGRISRLQDPYLYAAAETGMGMRILRQNPWEMLISFIISQNRNIPAIRRSIAILCELAGEELRDADGQVFHAFPEPEAIAALSSDRLAECRLGYRDKYVMHAAERVASGHLRMEELEALPDKEAREALLSLYGVGEKVASCILLFGLHRLDAFPVDVWMRRVLEREYPTGYDRERYAPVNGIMQQYLFMAARSGMMSTEAVT